MFNSNATSINEQMSFYSTLSIILLIIAVVFFVTAVVLWFVFKIPHSFRVLTGAGVDKEIRQISSATKSGVGYVDNSKNKAVISWNTSGMLNRTQQDEETALLIEDEATMLLTASSDPDATVVLGSEMDADATVVLDNLDYDPDATVVLDDLQEPLSQDAKSAPAGFEIEDEIIITGNSLKRN